MSSAFGSKAAPALGGAGLRFHHLGVATRSIVREMRVWQDLGYVQEGEMFRDPVQQIDGAFLTGPGPRLELIEQHPGSNVLQDWLDRGVKFYHQAFETAGLEARVAAMAASGARIVVEPVPAVAFGGRRIAFLIMRNMSMIELIEEP